MKIGALFLSAILICGIICGCKENKGADEISDVSANKVSSSTVSMVESTASMVESTVSKVESTVSKVASEATVTANTDLDPQKDNDRPSGETVKIAEIEPKTGVHNGIDVSKWQGKIDWSKVKNAGIDFAVIRIGFRGENGKIYKDEYADYNIQQASKNGILVGVYFFSTAVNTNEAVEEAEWVKENIKHYSVSLPVVYDCEGFHNSSSRMYNLSNKQITDNALSFINKIKSLGYDAMFYASKNDLETAFETNRIEAKSKIWIAHFDGKIYPEAKNPQYSGKYSMWQYTNKGIVNGVSGDVDLVVSYEAFTEKEAMEKGTVSEAEAPKPLDNTYKSVDDSVTAKDIVNLRKEATSTSEKLGELKAGEYLKRTAVGTNGWSKLLMGGTTVYAVTSYLTTEENYQKPAESSTVQPVSDGYKTVNDKVTPKNSVNLRREPTTNSQVVAEIQNGTVLDRIAKNDDKGWSKISYNGETVYAVSQYLTTDLSFNPNTSSAPSDQNTEMFFHKISDRVTAKTEVNLRSYYSQDDAEGQKVHLLKKGEYVERTGYSDRGWSRVVWNGQTLYAVTSYLEVES